MSCKHEQFGCECKIQRMEDRAGSVGEFILEVTAKCVQCDEPFRMLGLPAGLSFTRPMVSIDGLELRIPIEPQGDPRIFASAHFEMPPRTEPES